MTNPNSTHDDFCRCQPCHAIRIRRVDAFCEGLIVGFSLAQNALEGGQTTGTRNLPGSGVAGVFDRFSSQDAAALQALAETVRPPARR